jgi:hypothetical protein
VIDSTTGKEVPVQDMLSMQPLLSDGIKGMTAADHHGPASDTQSNSALRVEFECCKGAQKTSKGA